MLPIPYAYLEVIPAGKNLFSALYQFENGLRLAIHEQMSLFYDDWWESKVKFDLPRIYEKVEDRKQQRDLMPWVGSSSRVSVLPIHLTTLGEVEEIVKKYQSECIPELFRSLHFFLGHMEYIKLVRNLYAHMFPCLTDSDARSAKSEIRTLCQSLREKLPSLLSMQTP